MTAPVSLFHPAENDAQQRKDVSLGSIQKLNFCFFFSGVREASPAGSQYVEKLCQHSMEMYKKLAQLVDLCKRTIKTRYINNWMLFHNSVAGEAAGKVMP